MDLGSNVTLTSNCVRNFRGEAQSLCARRHHYLVELVELDLAENDASSCKPPPTAPRRRRARRGREAASSFGGIGSTAGTSRLARAGPAVVARGGRRVGRFVSRHRDGTGLAGQSPHGPSATGPGHARCPPRIPPPWCSAPAHRRWGRHDGASVPSRSRPGRRHGTRGPSRSPLGSSPWDRGSIAITHGSIAMVVPQLLMLYHQRYNAQTLRVHAGQRAHSFVWWGRGGGRAGGGEVAGGGVTREPELSCNAARIWSVIVTDLTGVSIAVSHACDSHDAVEGRVCRESRQHSRRTCRYSPYERACTCIRVPARERPRGGLVRPHGALDRREGEARSRERR